MNTIEHGNDLQEILTQALEQMKMVQGEKFDLSTFYFIYFPSFHPNIALRVCVFISHHLWTIY